jgi:hypothetical protein
MADVKVGHISREPGYLFYVGGDGAVTRTPIKGHRGTKAKVGQVSRTPNSLCWVAGNGDVVCRRR